MANIESVGNNIPKFGLLERIKMNLQESSEVQAYKAISEKDDFIAYQQDATHMVATAGQSLGIAKKELAQAQKMLENDPNNEAIKSLVSQREQTVKILAAQDKRDEDFLNSLNDVNEKFHDEVDGKDKEINDFNQRFNEYNNKFDRSKDDVNANYKTY